MTTYAVQTLLAADAALTAVLTGGVYTYEALGRNGISRAGLPGAYDADGWLKPLAVVQAHITEAADGAGDLDARSLAAEGRVEITLYADGDAGYAALTAARDRVYTLLHGTRIDGAGRLRWISDADDGRDSKLNNVAIVRSVYSARAGRGDTAGFDDMQIALGQDNSAGLLPLPDWLPNGSADDRRDVLAEWHDCEARIVGGDRRVYPVGRAWSAWTLRRCTRADYAALQTGLCAGGLAGAVTVRLRDGRTNLIGTFNGWLILPDLSADDWAGDAWRNARLLLHDLVDI